MTKLADLHTGFAAEASADRNFYLDEVTMKMSRGTATALCELLGEQPIRVGWASRLRDRLKSELEKTIDDLQHEKREAATKACQAQALHPHPAPGNVLIEVRRGDARWIRAWAQTKIMGNSTFHFIVEAAQRVNESVDVALGEVRDGR